MMKLYTSDTCPKGVAAYEWLTARQIEFEQVNLDQQSDNQAEHTLRLLIRQDKGDDNAPLALPALTKINGNQEVLAALGFEPNFWEDVVHHD